MDLLEHTAMNVKRFKLFDDDSIYYIAIGRIKVLSRDIDLKKLFLKLDSIQDKEGMLLFQFFCTDHVLDYQHVCNACFFTLKAIKEKTCISNKNNLEFLLYLSTNRQIDNAIQDFGIKPVHAEKEFFDFCIVGNDRNILKKVDDIFDEFLLQEVRSELNTKNVDKFNKVKDYFSIKDLQMASILHSYDQNSNENLDSLYLILNDLIREKMVLLSLEKAKMI
jgi:tRNA threonylcarbamoyladenosine modification (KEOPS) complex Cgi121 subunit